MNITNDIARRARWDGHIHQGLFFNELIVCTQDDFPCISLRYRLAFFEPLNHLLDELFRNNVFPIFRKELGTRISRMNLASAYGEEETQKKNSIEKYICQDLFREEDE